ncbi:MAG: arginine--tRNA ligase [Oscillospiraceae bacterium]|nr:arginine--tRNA ligase [Oscillospiraceae bacterium]
MRNLVAEAKAQYKELIEKAVNEAIAAGELPEGEIPKFNIEIPADNKNGDLASNVAMVSAKAFRKGPRQIADAIVAHIDLDGTYFEKAEVAGPGFLNVFYAPHWFAETVSAVLTEKDTYGTGNMGEGKKVMVEFVSANPTGPMHMGNARGGAIGDGLAEAMKWCGYDVTREFYINDAGNQIEKFGKSLEARYLQLHLGEDAIEFPEDGYHGEDIKVRAKEFTEINGDKYVNAESSERKAALVAYALPANVEGLQRDLGKYSINYDVWFRESSLYNDGSIEKVVKILTEKGLTYEKDGALWYKNAEVLTERFKKEGKTDKQIEALELKDDVIIRANGNPTYFAGDIAYHYNKFAERGFDKVINVWGADHHGHVARLQGAMDAVGLDGSKLDVVLMQMVELMRDGKPEKMSKRTGKAITLTDLLDEVPIDAARFLFNMREPNTHLLFDLGLAVKNTNDNPVYYVQYAHARICSILRALAEEGTELKEDISLYNFTAPEEFALVTEIAKFPGEIEESVKTYDPSRITKYAIEVATMFHKFYNACRVRGESEEVVAARTALCAATKTVIKNVLTMLKVSVPESM